MMGAEREANGAHGGEPSSLECRERNTRPFGSLARKSWCRWVDEIFPQQAEVRARARVISRARNPTLGSSSAALHGLSSMRRIHARCARSLTDVPEESRSEA